MTDSTPLPAQAVSPEGDQAALNPFLPLLLLLFVGSGCAALVYEVVWLQMLQLVIGSTTVSMGVILGTFMGGMCLGSLLLPRLVSARWHPLLVYAVLEVGIGVVALLLLLIIPGIEHIYTSASHGAAYSVSLVWRGIAAVLCLLPPTLLMGATLPAIARWVKATPAGVSWLGFFYGGNIVGAVAGCLLAGFYLLPEHNMVIATFVGFGFNIGVAVIGFVLAFATPYTPPPQPVKPLKPAQREEERSEPVPVSVYFTIALSGLTALGAEVVWTRQLSLLLGATVYTFSIILAMFLLGLGIGSTGGSLVARFTASPRMALGICQLLLTAAMFWAATSISRTLPWLPIDPSFRISPWYYFQIHLMLCLWTVIPAAVLWGASFPLALAAAAGPGRDPGRLVGGVYAANTVGAIVGAVLFALVMVPWIGTAGSQRMLLVLAGVSGLVALAPLCLRLAQPLTALPGRMRGGIGEQIAAAVLIALAAPVIAILAWFVIPMPWHAVAWGRYAGAWAYFNAPGIVAEEDVPTSSNSGYERYCIFVGEGANVSVAVTKSTSGYRYFHGAGKVQASSDPQDMRLQRMLGHITALVHGNPQDVLVVACGAGVTAGSFVPYDSVKRIVICDIEPMVPAHVAPMFARENHNVIGDPRTKVILDDGRHFIRTTDDKFDIITSDPIDPWVKGCAALNTIEYYEMCKARLKPGGVMALWIPLYENSEESINSIVTTFFTVFPNGIIWSNDYRGAGYDAVLFGQVEPTRIDVDRMQQFINDHPAVARSLTDVGFGGARQLVDGSFGPGDGAAVEILATYAGQARDMQGWMKPQFINRDINLRLQYLAGMAYNQQIGPQILGNMFKHYRFPEEIFSGSPETIAMLKRALFDNARPQGQ